MMMVGLISLATAAAATAPACPVKTPILVMAHRGASAERPEQTLAAFERAIDEGADYIELDLVLSRDGVLIVRHENELSGTTDVAARPEFAGRKKTKTIDGRAITGWFTEDFTAAELRTLRGRERMPDLRTSSARFDGLYPIASFEEVIRMVRAKEAERKRTIGIYPEIKHAAYFRAIGLPHEAPLLTLMTRYGYTGPRDAMIIHSFEVGILQRLHALTRVRLNQIVAAGGGPADQPDWLYKDMTSPAGLKQIARYATGLNADAALAYPDLGKAGAAPGALISDAHRAGLSVYIWTIRPENLFLPAPLKTGTAPGGYGNMAALVDQLARAGADGIVTDAPGTARTALIAMGCRAQGG